MLAIRQEQYQGFAKVSHDEFLQKMCGHLRKQFESAVKLLSDEKLLQFIELHWGNANQLGLMSELGVCSYLEAICGLGDSFITTESWAADLSREDLDEIEKLSLLNDGLLCSLYPLS